MVKCCNTSVQIFVKILKYFKNITFGQPQLTKEGVSPGKYFEILDRTIHD